MYKISSLIKCACHSFDFNCVKTVRTWGFSGPYFPALGLHTERYGVFSPTAGKHGPEKPECCHFIRSVHFI